MSSRRGSQAAGGGDRPSGQGSFPPVGLRAGAEERGAQVDIGVTWRLLPGDSRRSEQHRLAEASVTGSAFGVCSVRRGSH